MNPALLAWILQTYGTPHEIRLEAGLNGAITVSVLIDHQKRNRSAWHVVDTPAVGIPVLNAWGAPPSPGIPQHIYNHNGPVSGHNSKIQRPQ